MHTLTDKYLRSHLDIHILRASVILIFLVFGIAKWFEFEVRALEPLISTTWLNILYRLFGVHGGSYFLGIVEGIAYLSLIIGYRNAKSALIGDILTITTGVVTLSLLPQLGKADSFILKDALLIGAGLVLLKHDLGRLRQTQATSN